MIEVPEPEDDDGPERVLAEAKRSLEEGVSVMIFPEGTRSQDGQMGRFHSGAFRLAAETGADLLPVVLYNSRTSIYRGTWWITDFAMARQIGPRITHKTFERFESLVLYDVIPKKPCLQPTRRWEIACVVSFLLRCVW